MMDCDRIKSGVLQNAVGRFLGGKQEEMITEIYTEEHNITFIMEEVDGTKTCKGCYIGEPNEEQTKNHYGSYALTNEKTTIKEYKCASFFAGVGGIDIGFEEAGFKTLYANEVDPYPVKTFELNMDLEVDERSIEDVKSDEVPKECNVYLAGFPCTDISIAGYRQGLFNEDGSLTRSGLYYELLRLIKANKPQVVFLENVKNLVGHNNGETFRVIYDSLVDEGYHLKYQVLNAMEYGNVPQNRERIYIVGFQDEEMCKRFEFPTPVPRTKQLADIMDFENELDEKYYYTPGKYKGNLYEKLNEAMDDPNTVYQWRRKYVRKNMSGVVPTLTANQGCGGHNVCLIRTKHGIRKMTPHECFNAQGFPEDFKLPTDMAESRLYKQAGNSVCVSVISRIAENIRKAIEG